MKTVHDMQAHTRRVMAFEEHGDGYRPVVEPTEPDPLLRTIAALERIEALLVTLADALLHKPTPDPDFAEIDDPEEPVF